ncbi:hypothetical protein PISMIDRAFT_18857 [Pisolithus microcarpus 441]|uniref:Unplaced genomic scaffold scaffold_415, whole genome shotgun sequence n=1 Tax=Pisolithus microcarpus 441 TaxID=765257 RepID=A0A0C9XIV9_9AGAM|nr:hypothetical protein PISMIDRAFT_18857 [Pisolithus microcarpus 441]
MPRQSKRKQVLLELDEIAVEVAITQIENVLGSDDEASKSNIESPIVITPPTPPLPCLSNSGNMLESSSDSSVVDRDTHFERLLSAIKALRDEVCTARVLFKPAIPLMRAPQIQLLPEFADHWPDLFRKKLHVSPDTFNFILDSISGHPIFQNNSPNRQLPVALQLAIFLNHTGHYGNAISPEDVRQWAGVSVRSVINCTHRIMITLLNQHDNFIFFPNVDDIEMDEAREFVEG